MKRAILGLAFFVLASPAFAGENRYEINIDRSQKSYDGSAEIEMRNKYNPSDKYRGQIENDGSVRMKNYKGDILRGTIDSDGSGRLRDQEGNIYRVRPR